MARVLYFMVFLCTVSACANKVDGVIVDEELAPYYELFRIEAEQRGVIFDNGEAQIEGYLQQILDSGVLGLCRAELSEEDNPAIFISEKYWETATDLEREYVMFHELGHCFLDLGHDNTSDTSGICISIMASGVGDCIENYTSGTRDMLLDQLFGQ